MRFRIENNSQQEALVEGGPKKALRDARAWEVPRNPRSFTTTRDLVSAMGLILFGLRCFCEDSAIGGR